MLKDGTIVLHQIPKLKKLFQDKEALKNMQPRPNPTPAIPITAINDDKPCDKTTYLSYLMTLYHIAHKYRYDILNACSMLSCIPNPTIKDWHSLMYLYGYVKNTMNYCLHINPSKIEHEINISADSAYAVHINDHHKSHTGYKYITAIHRFMQSQLNKQTYAIAHRMQSWSQCTQVLSQVCL
jgi:hypothetical protein